MLGLFPRGVMVKAQNCGKQVQTSVTLLHLLSDKYTWERHEPPYPSSYGLNNTTSVLLEEWI